ncbi:hypothetical protein [Inhella proteolytica]|uniref:Uncharacterized protein n=1 Tax=Inhella proteolytica TaxID=2795029 RepID=A0A931J0A6_9BURK|nr:hypothetical protein [Inhella proteolytica]MBH9577104.1 hypothetical protein [Inhella proteolytica]
MMVLVVGIGNLLVGLAYSVLGLLSAWEAYSQYRTRGLSRFGLGFSLMAASCGPHHLVHGWCVLTGGGVSPALFGITLLGLPAGLVFCALRLEAMRGGLGDRILVVNPVHMAAVAAACLGGVGLLAGWSLHSPAPVLPEAEICTPQGLVRLADGAASPALAPLTLFANLFVTVAYGLVGWYLLATQVRRYVLERTWSLSGLSLGLVFPTCAAMHLIVALAKNHDAAALPFDLLGVPASIYFLWVVRRLHNDSVIDWNRRPLVGIATAPVREAPWSERSTVPR